MPGTPAARYFASAPANVGAAGTVVIKTMLDSTSDIRRMTVPADATLDGVLKVVAAVYARGATQLGLAWRDEDGDLINMRTDADWREAVRLFAAAGQTLRFVAF